MSEAKVGFLKKPMPIKMFWGLVLAAFVFVIVVMSLDFTDTDMYFIIATGDSIRENGIPVTNLWSIDKSPGFVAQQWLYAVIVSVVSEGGPICLWLFTFTQIFICVAVMFWLCKTKGLTNRASFLCVALSSILSLYLFNIRPQTFTITLLLLECVALEKFIKTEKGLWLLLLPFTMLLEMNGHMSMWFMHYAIVLAYVVPAFYSKYINSTGIRKGFSKLIIAVIAMTGAMFANPYGIDGILYFPRSMMSGAFDYVDIAEMRAPLIMSIAGVFVLLFLCAVMFFLKKNILSSVSFHMTLGLTVMMCMAMRNTMYIPIVAMFLFFDIYRYAVESNANIDWQKDVKNYLYLVFAPVIVLCMFIMSDGIISTANDNVDTVCEFYEPLDQVADYLDNHVDKDARLFTGFNTGAYFEYRGYSNVYIDARPELYTKTFCGKDIIVDFRAHCIDGMFVSNEKSLFSVLGLSGKDMTFTTKADMEEWLDYYDFEYFITDANMPYITAYLTGSDDYEMVDIGDSDIPYLLFHKKG